MTDRRGFFGVMAAAVAFLCSGFSWPKRAEARGLYESPAESRYRICRADVPNSRGRVYTRKALETMAAKCQGQRVPVVADGADPNSEPIPISYATVQMDGDYLVADMEQPIPDTAYRTGMMAWGTERDEAYVITSCDFVAVLACKPGNASEM